VGSWAALGVVALLGGRDMTYQGGWLGVVVLALVGIGVLAGNRLAWRVAVAYSAILVVGFVFLAAWPWSIRLWALLLISAACLMLLLTRQVRQRS
jgi:hypothetical protein